MHVLNRSVLFGNVPYYRPDMETSSICCIRMRPLSIAFINSPCYTPSKKQGIKSGLNAILSEDSFTEGHTSDVIGRNRIKATSTQMTRTVAP